MIGATLNGKQVATLQLVADVCGGCPFARFTSLVEQSENRVYRDMHNDNGDVTEHDLKLTLHELEAEGLVECKDDPKRGLLFGLSHDGKRCNRINVDIL